MKKTLLGIALATAATVATAGGAQAQASGSVLASATIPATITVTKVADVNFGNLTPGTGATLTPGGTAGAGQTIGVLQINHDANVNVAASVPANLTSASGATMAVAFQCGYSSASSGALDAAAGACTALGQRNATALGTAQDSYIQIGGDIAAAATTGATPGVYSGTLSFTVTPVY